MDQNAFRGQWTTSPFLFKPHNVTSLKFLMDGSVAPSRPFTPNFAEGPNQNYTRCFLSLFRGLSQFDQSYNFIDYERYKEFFTLYVVDFNEDISGCREHLSSKRLSTCSLQIDFLDNSNDNLKVVVTTLSTEELSIDSQRNIYKSFVL